MTQQPRWIYADWVTVDQAAKALGKSRSSVVTLIRAGELAAINVAVPGSKLRRFRISPESLRAWPSMRPDPARPTHRKTVKIPVIRGIIARRIEQRRLNREKRAAREAAQRSLPSEE